MECLYVVLVGATPNNGMLPKKLLQHPNQAQGTQESSESLLYIF